MDIFKFAFQVFKYFNCCGFTIPNVDVNEFLIEVYYKLFETPSSICVYLVTIQPHSKILLSI